MARTQGERKAETRSRLLDAAAELFAAQGIDAVSVDAVAEAAGRTSGAVYAHFGSKHGLLLALLDAWKDSLLTVLLAEVAVTDSPAGAAWQPCGPRCPTPPTGVLDRGRCSSTSCGCAPHATPRSPRYPAPQCRGPPLQRAPPGRMDGRRRRPPGRRTPRPRRPGQGPAHGSGHAEAPRPDDGPRRPRPARPRRPRGTAHPAAVRPDRRPLVVRPTVRSLPVRPTARPRPRSHPRSPPYTTQESTHAH